MCLDGILGNEKLRGDLAIAEAAGHQGKDFELTCCNAEGLLLGLIGSERFGGDGLRGDKHLPHHNRFTYGFATARNAEPQPDTEGREEDGDKRAIELDGVFNDDEAVFGDLEGGDEEAADEAEDEDMALHGVLKKYIVAQTLLKEHYDHRSAAPQDKPSTDPPRPGTGEP